MINFNRCMKVTLILLLSFILVFSLTSCMPQKKPEANAKPQQSKQEEEKKPPKELVGLQKSITKIETALKGLHEKNKQPFFMIEDEMNKEAAKEQAKLQQAMQPQQGEGEGGGGGGGESGGQGGGGQGGGGEGGGGEGGGQKQPQPMIAQKPPKLSPSEVKIKQEQMNFKEFEGIKEDVMSLHSAWNSFEPIAIKEFAPQNALKDFEMALDTLTKTVNQRDDYASLLAVNALHKTLPDFFMSYDSKTPPELDRVKYAVENILLVVEKQNYSAAEESVAYLEETWTRTRPQLKKDNMETMAKFEFALTDLKTAIKAKDDMVIEAKSKVIMDLVKEVEKKSKKEQGEEGGQEAESGDAGGNPGRSGEGGGDGGGSGSGGGSQ